MSFVSSSRSLLVTPHRLFTLLLASLLIVSLSGCWKVNVVESSVDENESHSLRDNNRTKKFFSFGQGTKKPKEEEVAEEVFSAIKYDVILWDNDKVEQLDMEFVAEQPEVVDKVLSIDEQSIDFGSNAAIKYRYMPNDQPYLDLVNSQKYLELGWHFANTKDSEDVKKISINHAKKAYKFARQLMGDDGGKVVTDMLEGKVIKNRTIKGIQVTLAKCEFYNCMLVIQHQNFNTPVLENSAEEALISEEESSPSAKQTDSEPSS